MTQGPGDHPVEITLADGGRRMDIAWEDGATTRVSALELRRGSRSAGAVAGALRGEAPEPAPTLTVSRIEPIGSYALRLAFSDGHDRGIFPWSYLRQLGAAGEA